MILPSLILQKRSKYNKARDHYVKLEERLKSWETGHIRDLVTEGRNIQNRLKRAKQRPPEGITRVFAKLRLQEKVNAAMRFLSEENDKGGI